MSQSNIKPDRFPLTNTDRNLISKAKVAGVSNSFYKEVANSVEKQGWISDKQRKVLLNAVNTFSSFRNSRHQADYTESDWEITDYELCAGWHGD